MFLVSFLALRNGPIQMPHQGLQSVKAASSLLEGRGFEVAPGFPFAKFGPLYPALLALLAWSGMEVIPAVYLVNCVTFAATLFGVYALSRAMAVRSPWAAPTFYSLFASNYYLLRMARADSIAICMSLFAILGTIQLARRRSHLLLLGTALACALATTARYMAVFTLLPVIFAALLLFREVGWRRRLIDFSLFGVVAAGPIAAWVIRNQLATGYPTGVSRSVLRIQATDTSLSTNVMGLLKTIHLDLFGYGTMGLRRFVYWGAEIPFAVFVTATGLGASVLLLLVCWFRRRDLWAFIGGALRERTRAGYAISLAVAYAAIYLVALVILWTIGNNDPIHTRFAAPLYAHLVLFGFVLFTAISRSHRPGWPEAALLAVGLLIATPNTTKSVRLLGSFPGEELTEIRSVLEGVHHWHRSVTWSGQVRPQLPSSADGMLYRPKQ